jgi:hypothetical protein
MSNKNKNKLFISFHSLYIKLFKINDSPQRIALGLGLGVFSGIFPGTGPIASLFLAFLFRANRASALIGSLLTNTWLSVLIFILSVKAGSVIFGIRWQQLRQDWNYLLINFNWRNLFKLSALKVILPVFIGYFVIALAIGLLVYLITLPVIIQARKRR